MMTSIAVMIGGIVMKYFHFYWIDPVFSILIAIYLLYLSWDIFKSSLKIIMQFTPEDIDIKEVAERISKLKAALAADHLTGI